ncbi:Glucose 1-dehydrogenase [compost metagenome]
MRDIGHHAIGVVGDVADLQHHHDVLDMVENHFGGLDIYIANAGVINLTASHNVTPEDFDRHFAINTRGVFFGVQTIAPLIRDGGNIIVTSSLAATKVLPDHAVYAGSKAAVAAFAKNWALEFKARRIRVNVLSPGPVETEILGKLGVSEAGRPEFEDQMASLIPAGRMGRPEELARAALFLASDAGSFINGIELHADGGMALA